jgi:hypothetical protein
LELGHQCDVAWIKSHPGCCGRTLADRSKSDRCAPRTPLDPNQTATRGNVAFSLCML